MTATRRTNPVCPVAGCGKAHRKEKQRELCQKKGNKNMKPSQHKTPEVKALVEEDSSFQYDDENEIYARLNAIYDYDDSIDGEVLDLITDEVQHKIRNDIKNGKTYNEDDFTQVVFDTAESVFDRD